jgi:hypothetical protein
LPLCVGLLPYLVICAMLRDRLNTDWAWLALLPYFFALGVLNRRFLSFRCPRCGERFYGVQSNVGLNHFQRKCRNCGLRKWQCE